MRGTMLSSGIVLHHSQLIPTKIRNAVGASGMRLEVTAQGAQRLRLQHQQQRQRHLIDSQTPFFNQHFQEPGVDLPTDK